MKGTSTLGSTGWGMEATAPSVAALLLWASAGCNLGGGVDLRDVGADGPRGEADTERADSEGWRDVDVPDVGPGGGGPLTFVCTAMEVTTERRCDFDGDGAADNAVADLGTPTASIFASTFNTAFAGYLVDGDRLLVHLPWVEDVSRFADEAAALVILTAEPVEEPNDPENDFDGAEPFYAHHGSLDGCGEPLFFAEARLSDGEITIRRGTFPLFVTTRRFAFGTLGPSTARIAAGGGSLEAELCIVSTITQLGEASLEGAGHDRSMLEFFVAGGAAFGVPTVPGLQPDVDVDGDGLERLELDGDGYLARCIDGDLTIMDGRDCYADPRMADGFAFSVDIASVRAVFAGRQPRWDSLDGDEPCDSPPETSLFDAR